MRLDVIQESETDSVHPKRQIKNHKRSVSSNVMMEKRFQAHQKNMYKTQDTDTSYLVPDRANTELANLT